MPRRRRAEPRQVGQMTGQELALEVARDLLVLPKDERAKAVKFINAMSEAIDRETEALSAK